MSQAQIPFAGYPAPGSEAVKIGWRGHIIGPANYQVGGYNLNASALGMSCIEEAGAASLDYSGNYYARVVYPNNAANNEAQAVPPTYVTIKWYAANNSEVGNNTNLSAEISLFRAIGI